MWKFGEFLFWSLTITNYVSVSYSYFNCEKGVYETLIHIVEGCQETSNAPNLRTFRKMETRISGPTLVEMMEDYCSLSDRIYRCGKGMVEFIPCLSRQMQSYETLINKSHWFCSGGKVKGVIADIFERLPVEELDYGSNACYRAAPAKTYDCLRRYLNSVSRQTERKETTRRILASFRCSFRKMAKECSRDTSLLLTTMEYDWLFIPPVLGFNLSDILITVSLMKV